MKHFNTSVWNAVEYGVFVVWNTEKNMECSTEYTKFLREKILQILIKRFHVKDDTGDYINTKIKGSA